MKEHKGLMKYIHIIGVTEEEMEPIEILASSFPSWRKDIELDSRSSLNVKQAIRPCVLYIWKIYMHGIYIYIIYCVPIVCI